MVGPSRAGERFNDVIEKVLNEAEVRHCVVVQTLRGVALRKGRGAPRIET